MAFDPGGGGVRCRAAVPGALRARRPLGYASLMKSQFTAIIEPGEKFLVATCAEVPEAVGQGMTREEALRDLAGSIQSVLDYRRDEARCEVLGAPADGGDVEVAVGPGLDTQPKHLAVGQEGRAGGVRSPDPIRPDEPAQACRQLRRQVPDPKRTKRPASGKGSRRRERVKC